jgi:SAM-dependent methyltransferase
VISRIRRSIERAVLSVVPQIRFAIWSLRHSGGSFKDFYVSSVVGSLDGKKVHNSLGPRIKKERIEGAQRAFNNLVALGVRPGDGFVDYGCGTLRLGALFIEYLEPDHYFGFDIDERILSAGRARLSPTLIEAKRPTLEVISSESVDRVAAKRPRWVCSKGVLQHVPPNEMNEYFGFLATLLHAGADGFLNARLGSKIKRIAPKTWVYEFEWLQQAAALHALKLERLSEVRSLMSLKAISDRGVSRAFQDGRSSQDLAFDEKTSRLGDGSDYLR